MCKFFVFLFFFCSWVLGGEEAVMDKYLICWLVGCFVCIVSTYLFISTLCLFVMDGRYGTVQYNKYISMFIFEMGCFSYLTNRLCAVLVVGWLVVLAVGIGEVCGFLLW